LFQQTGAIYFFLLFMEVDTVLTIIHRLILKQNIFEAHRLHFYQLLANEKKIPHLIVSALYALLQAVVIAIVIFADNSNPVMIFLMILIPLVASYLLIKPSLMKLKHADIS
jgi:hypothetical protein